MKTLTTGIVAATLLLSAPAFAQDPLRNQPTPAPRMQQVLSPVAAMNDQQIAGFWRASKLDGLNIYNNTNEKIGEIDDVLLDRNGKAMAVVVDVGGFLGIGMHRVALRFEDVRFSDLPRSSAVSDSSMSTTTGTASRTAPVGSSAVGSAPSAGSPPTSVAADRDRAGSARGSAKSMMPDHAVLDMTKDQLKALPQITYNR